MMQRKLYTLILLVIGAILGVAIVHFANDYRFAQAVAGDLPAHPGAHSKDGGVVVELCDGVTKLEIPGLKPGQRMSRAQAQAAADALMAQWAREHPGARWQVAQASPAPPPTAERGASPSQSSGETSPAGAASSPAASATAEPTPTAAPTSAEQKKNEQGAEAKKQETEKKSEQAGKQAAAEGEGRKSIPGPGKKGGFTIQQGDTYASFNQRDYMVWKAETDKFVQEGKGVFHDANKLGSTIGISCDMCHPDGANTHPETYPKYQVQLQRVALLRDMIDWCIENPVKGKTMSPDDERLRALEAYILAQRKGVPLDYGKH